MKFSDLHLHTNYSDGTYTPEDLVKKAVGAGLSCIAITDHDTISGIKEAIEAANPINLEVLPGIEISAEVSGKEVHILGYLIDYNYPYLLKKLDHLRENRILRIHKIVSKLNNIGINLQAEDVFEVSCGAVPGRLHVARALLKKGFIKSTQEAFNKYIGDNGPAYSLGFRFSPKEAISVIKESGGIPVLAHPYLIRDDNLVNEFIRSGIMGLEVYYPEHSQGEINFYLNLAKENNLLVTGGSDYHGSAKPSVRIGSIKLPYSLVEKLKEAKKSLR
ncbi:MAG: PHP domain-containing protein [Candidatus Omnitrophica bacterium]|nr:PHP domain-containing protein [Candidatus Omnitrophota bacterium]